jgi:hypothetical protein
VADDVRLVRTPTSLLVPVAEYDPLTERQYDIWWRQLIAGPTRQDAGAPSNDFPGAYLYEPRARREWFVFYDGAVDWRDTECGLTVRDGVVHLGLWSEQPLDGELHVRVERDRPRRERWEALVELLRWCTASFLPPAGETPPDFCRLAAAALAEIRDPDSGLFEIDGVRGHRMYVAGTSEAWRDDEVDHLELFCQTDLAWPLLAAGEPAPAPGDQAWGEHLAAILGAFYDERLGVFSNSYPLAQASLHGGNVVTTREQGREATNVWYHMYNHARLLEIALLRPGVAWRDQLRDAVEHTERLVAANRYLLPLLWWLDDGEPYGAVQDYAAAGAFAWLAVRAWDVFGDERHLEHAAAALETIWRLPFEHLHAEALLLPRAAWAADRLAARDGGRDWERMRDGFAAATLRMMYWRPPLTGLFNGCAGMLYPAFMENVQVILALEPFLDATPFPLRRVAAHTLASSAGYFDGRPPGPHVPLENVATPEYPYPGRVGKEIYGTGEVLWAARLQARLS